MSGAQAETDFDESVFDAPAGEPAPKPEAEAAKPEPTGEGIKTATPASQIEDTARKAGWSGKDDWKGDPADWLEAPEFILKAVGDVLPSMRKSLEDAKTEIGGLKKSVKAAIGHLSKARQDGYEQRGRELQAELESAASLGDVAAVNAATKGIVALEKEVSEAPVTKDEPEEPAEFTAWKADNPWWEKDKPLTAACIAISEEVLGEGYTGKAQIKEVDKRIREAFPSKFEAPKNPNRDLPGAVEGGGILGRKPSGKSFSDMPKEHQDMWADMNKLHAMSKDSYAREYFAQEKT